MQKNVTMEYKDRNILKSYFKKGCIPSEKQFAELIDSVPNIAEDGQIKRTETGWSFYPAPNKPLQLSLYDSYGNSAAWTLKLNSNKALELKNERGLVIYSIGQTPEEQEPDIPIEPAKEPEMSLESEDDKQKVESKEVEHNDCLKFPADKSWHDIISIEPKTDSFDAFQIFACLPEYGSEDLDCTYCIACHHGKSKFSLDCSHMHWWGWSGKVMIRWALQNDRLCLQIRSKKSLSTRAIFVCIK